METNRLKIKIGEHEFEADGPTEVVQAQFAMFKELVLSSGAQAPTVAPRELPELPQAMIEARPSGTLALEKIMRQDGRVISLTARAQSLPDAILLVAYGQKSMRNNDAITGGEILDGLKQSGQVVGRIDRIMDKLAADGEVIKIGFGRGTKYRMTNQGVAKGQQIAKSIIETVA